MRHFSLTLLLTMAAVLTGCKKQTFDERITKEVAEFNAKQGGQQTDPVTTLDSMHYDVEQRLLSYCYTISGVADDEQTITDEVRDEMHKQLLARVRGSINLKPYKEEGIAFRFVYFSASTGRIFIEDVFGEEDYR